VRGRGVAGDHVDAVHRHHREQVLALPAAHRDLVLVAGLADHIGAAFMPVHRQAPALAAVEQGDVGQAADRGGMGGKSGEQRRAGKLQGFHRPSSRCGYTGMKRMQRPKGFGAHRNSRHRRTIRAFSQLAEDDDER